MLRIVLWINVAMFLGEFVAGIVGHSTALLADSVDMLGDAIVYGFSLYVIGRRPIWQARGALLKGSIMAAFAAGIFVEAALKVVRGVSPSAELMSVAGLVALAANASVLAFLWRHRTDDLNMRSAWLCSRNDVIANGAILFAAGGVAITATLWPDIAVGFAIAALFGMSASRIIREALAQPV